MTLAPGHKNSCSQVVGLGTVASNGCGLVGLRSDGQHSQHAYMPPPTLEFIEAARVEGGNLGLTPTISLAAPAVTGDLLLFTGYLYNAYGGDPGLDISYLPGFIHFPDSPRRWYWPLTTTWGQYKLASGGEQVFGLTLHDNLFDSNQGHLTMVVLRPSRVVATGAIAGPYTWGSDQDWPITTTRSKAYVAVLAVAQSAYNPPAFNPPTDNVYESGPIWNAKVGRLWAPTTGEYIVTTPGSADHRVYLLEVSP